MFEQENKPTENLSEKLPDEKIESAPKSNLEPKSALGLTEIHTMPEKFLETKKKKKNSKLFFILLGIIVLLGLVAGGFYLFKIKMEKGGEISPVNLNVFPPSPGPSETNENVNITPSFVSKAITVRSQIVDEKGEFISLAKIFFLRGSLESDFEITLSSELPEEETDPKYRTVGGVYSFIPEDITLLKPVTLTFIYKEELIESDLEKDLKIGVFEDGFWEELESEIDQEKNTVNATLDHFTSNTYALIISKSILAQKEKEKSKEAYSFLETVLPSNLDSDEDGLTNEEEIIYQTESNISDTDEDGYSDGSEIVNLYSPLAGSNTPLLVSGLVNTYTNPIYHYTIFHPASFLAKAIEGTENREVMFTSPTSEFVEVLVQDNPKGLLVLDWYLKQSPGIEAGQVKQIEINGKKIVLSLDGQTVYLANRDKIFIITYNSGARTDLSFKSTFEMMIKSFKVLGQ